jgi:hypothetical protein
VATVSLVQLISSEDVTLLPECVIVSSALIYTECKMSDTRYKSVFNECTRDSEGTLGISIIYQVFLPKHSGRV